MFKVIAKTVRYDRNCADDVLEICFAHYLNAKACADKLEACADVVSVQIVEDFQTGEILYDSED